MRWSRYLCFLSLMFGSFAFACALLFLSPRVAYADMVDLAEAATFSAASRTYDTSADLTDSTNTFTRWLSTNVSTGGGSYSDAMVRRRRMLEDTVMQHTTGTEHMEMLTSWVARGSVGNNSVAWVSFDTSASPLPSGAQLVFTGLQSSMSVNTASSDAPENWTTIAASPDSYSIWVTPASGSGAVLCPYDSASGFFTVPVESRAVHVVFRLHLDSAPSDSYMRIWYNGWMHLYWDLVDASTVAQIRNDNQNTDKLLDTEGSDEIVDSSTVGQQVEDIQGISLWESITGIEEQLQEALTSTESDSVVVFPGLNLMGFSIPSAQVDVWAYSPIPQNTVRGFLTFICVCYYIRYMYGLVETIFGFRYEAAGYEMDGQLPVEYQDYTGASNRNWGLQ